MRRASIVLTGVTALVAFARPAYPCLNEVMRQEEAIKMVNAVEQALEKADYEGAQKALKGRHVRIPDEAIAARVQDARTLIALRVRTSNRDSLEWAVTYFDGRAKGSKDLKFKAWLAEAYEASGKADDARKILEDLKTRDLMPDAFAYATLARVSTKPEDRDAAIAACKTRTKVKSICTVPAKVSDATPRT